MDVSLACAGRLYPAHKFVLSTCSDYFKEMFSKNPCKHPIVFMKDVSTKDMEALLDFMYKVSVSCLYFQHFRHDTIHASKVSEIQLHLELGQGNVSQHSP